jgi:hypothetical protein
MVKQGSATPWVALVLSSLVGSAQAAPWSPRTDNFEYQWSSNYGWGSVARANELKSSFVEVFLPDRVEPGETSIEVLRSRAQFGDRVEKTGSSFTAGERVEVYAHLEPRVRNGSGFPEPAGPDGPVRAWSETRFLDQKVVADTMRLVNVRADAPVTRQGQKQVSNGPSPVWQLTDPVTITPWIHNRHEAFARSRWSDSWSFDKSTTVTLTFKVHANTGIHLGPGTPSWTELANHMYSSGGDNFTVLNNAQMAYTGIVGSDPRDNGPGRSLSASMQVFDTTHLRDKTEYCDEFGDCYWPIDPTYCPPLLELYNCGRPVAGAGFNRVRFADADQQARWAAGVSAEIESLITLSFDAEMDRDYLVVSDFFATAINGGWMDGSSTMSLLDIQLGNDATLSSRAAATFGLALPITRSNAGPPGGGTVPEPNTLALLLLAAGLLVQAQRFGTPRRPGGHRKPGNGALG